MNTAFGYSCLVAALSLPLISWAEQPNEREFTVSTKGGLSVKSNDKAFSFKLGGRAQMDYNNYDGVMNADQGGESGSAFFFRRSRVVVSGTIASDWAFKSEFNVGDNVGTDPSGDVTDLYIQYKGLGQRAVLTFGHQREPFGLENLTSSKYISTIERTAASNVFDTGRALGMNVKGYDDNWSYSAGVYEVGSDENEAIQFSYTARATHVFRGSDNALFHIGGGLRISDESVDGNDIKARPGIRQVDSSDRISSGDINAEGSTRYNLELAGVIGASHFSAEVFSATYDGSDGAPDSTFDGYYALAGWFITGEQRPYNKKGGAFDKVKPANKKGAWEIVGSFSSINLKDNAQGNEGSVLTLGVNWYANTFIRAGVNLVQTDYDVPVNNEDKGTGFAGRLQVFF